MKTNLVRLTMVGLAITSVLLMVVSCGPSPATEEPAAEEPVAEEPAAEEPVAEEPTAEECPFVVVACDVIVDLEPAGDWTMGAGSGVMVHLYDTLMTYKGEDTAEIVPVLLEEIPSVENGGISEDGLTYTFHLKPNAYFHDGTPLDAEAVKFSIDRQIALGLGPDYYWWDMDRLEVVDDLTFKIVLKEPSAMFLNMIATPWASRIINPTVVKEHEVDDDMAMAYVADHDAGSGPYILESYERDRRQVTMVRDPNYWGGWSEGPHIDKVIVRWIDESSTIRSMIEKGDADIVTCMTYEDWKDLGETEGITALAYPAMFSSVIYLNNQEPPLDDPRVRQALQAAMDTESLIEDVMGGMATPIDCQASRVYNGSAPAKNFVTYDLERAKALLEEAGYGDGFEFTCKDPGCFQESTQVLEVWQSDLAKIGVSLSIEQMDMGTFFSALNNPESPEVPACHICNTMGDFPDAWSLMNYNLNPAMVPPGCCNASLYENPRVTELLDMAKVEYDPAKRQEIYQEIYDITAEEVPLIWPFGFKQMVAMRDSVKGFEYSLGLGYQYFPFETMWLEE